MIKSFRGQLADGEQDTIRLSTNNGMTGYKIKKFELMPPSPGVVGQESVVKAFTVEQASVDGLINFDDSRLLAAAFGSTITGNPSVHPQTLSVIFDNKIFNQDIFLTHSEVNGSAGCNYYLELEQVRLDLSEATVATLTDMRGSN